MLSTKWLSRQLAVWSETEIFSVDRNLPEFNLWVCVILRAIVDYSEGYGNGIKNWKKGNSSGVIMCDFESAVEFIHGPRLLEVCELIANNPEMLQSRVIQLCERIKQKRKRISLYRQPAKRGKKNSVVALTDQTLAIN